MTALFAWLWQGLVLAALIELFLRSMPRLNAATRHVIYWAAMAGLLVLGGIGALTGISASGAAGPVTPIAGRDGVAGELILTLPSAPGWLIWSLLGAWLALAVRTLGRWARGLRHVTELRAEAVAMDDAVASRLVNWSRLAGAGRQARLCVTNQSIGACALGFRRPVILVSRRMVEALGADALDQVVMHEQAHLDRFDDWLRFVQTVVTALAGIHPATHFISRRIDREREAACDDRVVSTTGAAARYASCLADAAGAVSARVPTAVPAVLGGARSLRGRIVRLLDPRPDRGRRLARPALAAVAAGLTAVVVVAAQLPCLVVFAEAASVPRPALVVLPNVTSGDTTTQWAVPLAPNDMAPNDVRKYAETRAMRPGSDASAEAVSSSVQSVQALEPKADQDIAAAGADPFVGASRDIPAEALVGSGMTVSDRPPDVQSIAPASVLPDRRAPEPSLLSDASSLGRNSAAAARKVGLSVSGTVTRAGKAFGRIF